MNSLVKFLVDSILNEEAQTVALFGGGFKPPTKGHLEVVLQGLQENPEVKQVYILVGSGERNGVTQEESVKIWKMYQKFIPVSSQIIPVQSPFSFFKTYLTDHKDEKVYIFIGARPDNEEDEKDVAERSAFVKKYSENAIPVRIQTKGGVSGTMARKAALSGNNDEFITYFPSQLTDTEKQEIIDMISSVVKEDISFEKKRALIKKIIQMARSSGEFTSIDSLADMIANKIEVPTNKKPAPGEFKVIGGKPFTENINFVSLEKVLDDMFDDLDIDINFTKHFKERVIERGLTEEDIIELMSKIHDRYGDEVADLSKDENRVFTHLRKLVDIAAVVGTYGDDYLKDLILKTVYKRKSPSEPEFKTNVSSPKLAVTENTIPSIDIIEKCAQLSNHMIEKGYKIQPLPAVEFISDDVENAKNFLGKTAYYDPNEKKIVLYTAGRHPKDIVRSYAHEMIHHMQNLEGRLGDITTTNTTEDDHLNDIEAEANLKGTMTFRNWTDSLNEISLPKATQQISKLNPDIDAEEVAKDFIRLSPSLDKKDLFQYLTYDELKQELDKASQTKSQRRKQAKSMDLEDNKFIFYKDDNFTIYKLDDPSQHPESCEIAQGAKICVASNSKKYWNQYMVDGDGVLFYIRNKKYDIPHPESVIAFMFPRKGLKIGYTEMVDYNDEEFVQNGNYEEQKGYLSSIGVPTSVIEKMFKFVPDVKPLSYYIKNYKGKKDQLKVDGKTYFLYTPDVPPSMGRPKIFEDENGKVIGIIKPKGHVNKLSPIEKKWLKFKFPDLPDSSIYEITNVNRYWEENSKEVNLYNIENNKLVKVGKAHLPYGPEQINTFMSGGTVEIPDEFKGKTDSLQEKKVKDPFGLNAYARELAKGLEEEVLNEGAYDALVTKLSKATIAKWKEDLAKNPKTKKSFLDLDVDDVDGKGREIEFNYVGMATFDKKIDGYNVNGTSNSGEEEDKIPFVATLFTINPNILPQAWSKIIMDVKDVIRHEIEHLTQSGENARSGKYMEDDIDIRDMINKLKVLPYSNYFMLEKEVDAMLQGLYFKAKKSKKPFADVINGYLDMFVADDTITQEDKEKILKLWRSRRKALSLPLFENDMPNNTADLFTIYLDMDGVIVNFDKQFEKLTGMGPREFESSFGKEKFWDKITKAGVGFWRGMEWMPGGKELYNRVSKHNHFLLSAPSQDESSKIGKRMWRKDNTPNTRLILSAAKNKPNYADKSNILIDDRKDTIDAWKANGGIGILYTSAPQVMKELDKLGL